MYTKILVPTDGSTLSAKAIKTAVGMAKATGAKVIGLYVAPEHVSRIYGGAGGVAAHETESHYKQRIAADAESVLASVLKEAAAAGVESDSTYAASNSPYEEILKAAVKRKCDLIVMASHGRRGLAHLLLGSETQKVLTHSKIPVLVVR